jgi:hypothetical protein
VHIWRASELKAKPEVEAIAEKETAKPRTKPAWRIVLVKEAVMFGSWGGRGSRRVVDDPLCRADADRAVTSVTHRARL